MRVYKKHIERITIIYARNDKEIARATEYCLRGGYEVIRSSPHPPGAGRNADKVKLIAEREVVSDTAS
jgi:hypothetical protein